LGDSTGTLPEGLTATLPAAEPIAVRGDHSAPKGDGDANGMSLIAIVDGCPFRM